MEETGFFDSIDLYVEALRLISSYHFKLSSRRFILDLFDSSILTIDGIDRIFALKGLAFAKRPESTYPAR